MREKLRRTEKDVDDLRDQVREDQKSFVTHQHLEAVVEPLRRTLDGVQKDVKEILRVVAANRPKG